MASTRSSTPPINANSPRKWKDFARRASAETDPDKLAQIIKELCEAFDLRDQSASKSRVSE